ncbi:MAG: hypothetical protein A4S09_08015 [Proteobacteria bacterium SG_bin7]|nr:MAG: hypothetical protein A4S09_08015 [Proteobacteria bacterium SG_bin7]
MKVYLGLGSNQGVRKEFLRKAWFELKYILSGISASSTFESDALMPAGAPENWNNPFLNIVVTGETSLDPMDLLRKVKDIEAAIGRKPSQRWAPREIDIDLLFIDGEKIQNEILKIPHPEIRNRPFVLLPLLELNPYIDISPAWGPKIPFNTQKISWKVDTTQIMGILNLTPDSFSDGGELSDIQSLVKKADLMVSQGASILDVGAESTRPGAVSIDATKEMSRLGNSICELSKREVVISVDTRHPETAAWALGQGAHWINDVSGLTNPEMIKIAKNSNNDFIFMHNLGIPANPNVFLPSDQDPVLVVKDWAKNQIETLGIPKRRLIFDPGIGFGKGPKQSIEILRRIGEYKDLGVRILVGHSRKSFLRLFTMASNPKDRDTETLTVSKYLVNEGVDYIRVHDVVLHAVL